MRKLTIVYFDAGGGHRSAAEALKATLEAQHRPWDIHLLNLQELLDSLDVVRRATGLRIQDGYNLLLRKGWTRPSPQLLMVLQKLIRVYHRRTVKVLLNYWLHHPTDLVLSVIPLFNRAIAESVRETMPDTPFVTLLTDFADYPSHFWIERESEYLICGTERAKQQALDLGHHPRRVFETSGMVLKPKFYQKHNVDRVAGRERLGLDPTLPTGVVLFGGYGSSAMLEIAKKLSDAPNKVQLIMICGHNKKLYTELKELQTSVPMFVEGFTSNIDHYMSLGDFFIGKPGPGCISEALQFHMPVIVECNAKTLPQERYNTEWLKEKRMGIVLESFKEISSGVQQLLEEKTFAELRRNALAYSNQALFEIPVILDGVFENHVPYSVPAATPWAGMGHVGQDAAWAESH